MKKQLLTAVALIGLSFSASATLLVEQWQSPTGEYNGLAGADAVIAAGPAEYSGYFDVIDFTDDPFGFAGDIPGSSPWMAALATGATSTADAVNDFFVARITGLIHIASADTYNFRTYSDDGVRLKVGGSTVFADNGYHPESINAGGLFLDVGVYDLELVFFEGGGEASLEFSVAQGSGAYVHIPDLPGVTTSVPTPAGIAVIGFALMLCGFARKRRNS